jgi:hypothetical protein
MLPPELHTYIKYIAWWSSSQIKLLEHPIWKTDKYNAIRFLYYEIQVTRIFLSVLLFCWTFSIVLKQFQKSFWSTVVLWLLLIWFYVCSYI